MRQDYLFSRRWFVSMKWNAVWWNMPCASQFDALEKPTSILPLTLPADSQMGIFLAWANGFDCGPISTRAVSRHMRRRF